MTSGGSSGRGRARNPSPRTKAPVSRKRKAPSGSASGAPSGSSSGEKDRGAVAESSCGKQLKSLSWSEMGLIDPPEDSPLTFESVDSLWYRNCDYGSFLRQQLIPPLDVERNEEFVKEKGAVRLVKSSAMQIARSLGSILYSIPALAQLTREHAAANPAEIERLKQAVGEKDNELSKMAAESERKENHLQEQLNRANEMLLQRDQELEVERKKLAAVEETASAQKAKFHEELRKADDAGYLLFQQGFDAALAQVKHFNPKGRVDLSKVDRDKDLADIIQELEGTADDDNVDDQGVV